MKTQGKKLANVIKGHLSYEEINNINIINIADMSVPFCGSLDAFQNPPDFMADWQKELMQMEVVKSYVNGTRLDCFIQ